MTCVAPRGRASRTSLVPFLAVLLVALLAAAGCSLLAQGPTTWDLDLAIGDADRLTAQLTEVTAKGYRCARVARPDGGVVPQHVAILMARPRQSGAVPRISDIRVEVGWADDGVERFSRVLNTWAERGYELCGFTMAGSSQLPQRGFGLVAVLERLERRPPSGVSYRVVRTQRREDWPLVEAAAAEGLALTHGAETVRDPAARERFERARCTMPWRCAASRT